MSNIIFPEGVTWTQRYVTGGDFLDEGFDAIGKIYEYAKNPIIKVKMNINNSCESLLERTFLVTCAPLDTSDVTNMSQMFYACEKLESIPQLDTSNVTNMSSMFGSNSSVGNRLITIPQLDTSNVTNMSRMFYYCSRLKSIPQLDTSNVTNMGNMFYQCTGLIELPDFNCVKLTNFSSWLAYCTNLKKIGVVDCDSVTNIGYFFGNSLTKLTDFGGCRNLGKASSVTGADGNYFMYNAPNLTYESVMNVINGLYDRATAGLSVLTLKLHANHLAMLSEDDIAIATNKGWTIV